MVSLTTFIVKHHSRLERAAALVHWGITTLSSARPARALIKPMTEARVSGNAILEADEITVSTTPTDRAQ
jgi:hypothetical protein